MPRRKSKTVDMRTAEFRKLKASKVSTAVKLDVHIRNFRPHYAQCPYCQTWMLLDFGNFYCPGCKAPIKIFL